MSRSLAPGKQYVAAVFVFMFMIMESPVINEEGEGDWKSEQERGLQDKR